MDVAEDHPVGVDAEAVDDARQRRDAGAPHLGAEQPRGQPRVAMAQQPQRDPRHRRGAQHLGRVLGQRRERPRQSPADPALERRDRRAAAVLVVGGRGAVAREPAEQAAGDAERRVRQEMAVEVVAVGRPDALREPNARVVHAHPGGSQPRRHVGQQRRCVEGHGCVDRGRNAVRAHPRPHQRCVVVAWHDHDLALGAHPRADRAQHRPRERGRAATAPGQQLDHIAEQDEPVDVVERIEQHLQRLRTPQDVASQPGAQVQVGDDKRAHGGATRPRSGSPRAGTSAARPPRPGARCRRSP